MNLLYLSHMSCLRVENDIRMFESGGYKVTFMNTHKTDIWNRLRYYPEFDDIIHLYEPKSGSRLKIKRMIGKFFKALIKAVKLDTIPMVKVMREKVDMANLDRVPESVKEIILRVIKEKRIDIVYSAWGTVTFQEIRVIQKADLGIPIIHSIQSYPLREVGAVDEERDEPKKVREIFEKLDGRIHCSQTMYDYMNKHFNLHIHGKDLILMGYYRKDYFYKERLTPLSEKNNEPHLIFIGGTEFSQRTFNDVRQQISKIAKEGIHVHFADTKDKIIADKRYIHTFDQKNPANGEFATFMTQFDACIVLYNLDKRYTRYQNSLSERFLFALNAAIPVVVPKGYFAACEELIYKYQIGFTYDNLGNLKLKLSDKIKMEQCRKNAIRIAPELMFEKNFYKLDNLIKDLTC